MNETERLNRVFAALADPTRREMLARLRGGEATAGELAVPFGISQPAISKHLKVLESAGLVHRTVDRQWRRFSVVGDGLKRADDWLRDYEVFWSERFDALEEFLEQENKSKTPTPRKK
jgi:DNA-binding transcriptional ArsR family regulator